MFTPESARYRQAVTVSTGHLMFRVPAVPHLVRHAWHLLRRFRHDTSTSSPFTAYAASRRRSFIAINAASTASPAPVRNPPV